MTKLIKAMIKLNDTSDSLDFKRINPDLPEMFEAVLVIYNRIPVLDSSIRCNKHNNFNTPRITMIGEGHPSFPPDFFILMEIPYEETM